MTPANKVGRNDPCPCGSGEKFKRCCEGKSGGVHRRSRVLMIALATFLAAAIVFFIVSIMGDGGGGEPQSVWSPEHGHYHTMPQARTLDDFAEPGARAHV